MLCAGMHAQVFDKALGEPGFSEIYATLCFDLNHVLPTFKDEEGEEVAMPPFPAVSNPVSIACPAKSRRPQGHRLIPRVYRSPQAGRARAAHAGG